MHSLDYNRWSNLKDAGIVDFMDCALKDGRIRHAGFSYHGESESFEPIVDDYDWDFCQIQFNYMDTAYQAGLRGLKYVAKKGLGVAIMEPIKGGQLSGVVPDAVQKIWDKADTKRTPAEWALRYVWDRPEAECRAERHVYPGSGQGEREAGGQRHTRLADEKGKTPV